MPPSLAFLVNGDKIDLMIIVVLSPISFCSFSASIMQMDLENSEAVCFLPPCKGKESFNSSSSLQKSHLDVLLVEQNSKPALVFP